MVSHSPFINGLCNPCSRRYGVNGTTSGAIQSRGGKQKQMSSWDRLADRACGASPLLVVAERPHIYHEVVGISRLGSDASEVSLSNAHAHDPNRWGEHLDSPGPSLTRTLATA